MASLTKSDWKLVAIGAAIGALAVPVFQLLRVVTDSMTTRLADSDGTPGDGASGRTGNVINICVMGVMTTTRVGVNKGLPARAQAEIKGEEPAADHTHKLASSPQNGRS